MEIQGIKEVVISVIVAVVLSTITNSFQRKKLWNKLDTLSGLSKEITNLNDSSQMILLNDNALDSIIAQKLIQNTKEDSILIARIYELENKNKKYEDAIHSLEEDIKRSGIDYNELPDF